MPNSKSKTKVKQSKFKGGQKSDNKNLRSKNARSRDERGVETDKPAAYGSPQNATNDITWYAKYPALLASAASVPFPYRPGMLLPLDERANQPIPGVLSVNWIPSIGKASAPSDPINIACHEIFGAVRSAFSAELAVDAPDFGIYFVCLDSIFSYLASLKRVFRCLNAYTPENYATPDGVLNALGIPTVAQVALRQNKMELFSVINELIAMSRKFLCPALFPLFNRHYWLSDNVYCDAYWKK